MDLRLSCSALVMLVIISTVSAFEFSVAGFEFGGSRVEEYEEISKTIARDQGLGFAILNNVRALGKDINYSKPLPPGFISGYFPRVILSASYFRETALLEIDTTKIVSSIISLDPEEPDDDEWIAMPKRVDYQDSILTYVLLIRDVVLRETDSAGVAVEVEYFYNGSTGAFGHSGFSVSSASVNVRGGIECTADIVLWDLDRQVPVLAGKVSGEAFFSDVAGRSVWERSQAMYEYAITDLIKNFFDGTDVGRPQNAVRVFKGVPTRTPRPLGAPPKKENVPANAPPQRSGHRSGFN